MNKKDESLLFRVIMFMLAMLLIVELPHALALPFRGTPSYDTIGTLLSLLSFPLMYIAVIFAIKPERNTTLGDLGLDIEDRKLIPDLSIGGLAGIAGAGLVFGIAFFMGGQLRDPATLSIDLVFSVMMIAVPVSLLEELCYRGYLMTRMEKLWGNKIALILSSIFFSLVHFNWWSPLGIVSPLLIILFSFNLFLGGIVLGLSYYLSGRKLWAAVGYHFTWNIMAYSLFPVFPDTPVLMPEIFQIEWGVVSIAGFLFGLSILWILYTQFGKKK